jgi:putative ABC transport system permease protein
LEAQAMTWICLKMLLANRGKFLSMIGGVAFAALLMSQQSAIFCGVMMLTYSQISDVHDAEIWVTDANVRYVDDVKPISDDAVDQVRGVPGVEWAVPFFKGLVRGRLPEGMYQQIILIGLDDATLVGGPQEIVMGSLAALQEPDAVLIDEAGYRQLWPDQPYELGRILEISDRRAVIAGICKVSLNFQTFPVVYTRYNQAIAYNMPERRMLPFILVKSQSGSAPEELCRRIQEQTGLGAQTREQFMWTTLKYYLLNTGIPINFGITIFLGFIVGVLVAGQIFYLFTLENLPHFAMLKAMGTSNQRIVGMMFLQALAVGLIGFGLGVGPSTLFFPWLRGHVARLAFYMAWQTLAGTGAAVLIIVTLFSLVSIRRVLVQEPAIVFRG